MGRLARFWAAAVTPAFFFCLLSGVALAASYSQVVDNATPDRFQASGSWGTSSYSPQKYGTNYRFATPKAVSDAAAFRVRIPASGSYRVYARWPASPGYNPSAPVGIKTASGMEWVRVDETRNGGRWVLLGTFRMNAGDRYSILFSRWTGSPGYIVADAVKVVSDDGSGADGGSVTGQDVLAEAKTWLGVPYLYGGASRQGVDCSGLTMEVYAHFGIYLPHSAAAQYSYGTAVSSPGPGDLVFGDFNGNGTIGHVGIATGDGRMIDAPYPGTVVRYDPIYPQYTVGYKRLVPVGASIAQKGTLHASSHGGTPARLPVDEETAAVRPAR
ncbi:NlpC/P60 family protein [Rubrobacter calidifluminis]|uniref:golvesin C-terminal-like domain-containing protein n=1 Tax=Rubrobacter calidifluminis TaxID=1392640 RepID=UPI0023628ED9|nr:NlpC/P60 family protein [Rubrobacter calidifluminis]